MSKARKHVEKERSIKLKYYSGAEYKFNIFMKKGKRSFTTSKVARIYIAIPPETGWPGGDPTKNGFKVGGGK